MDKGGVYVHIKCIQGLHYVILYTCIANATVKEEPFIRIHKLNKIQDNLINIPAGKTKLQNLPLAKYYDEEDKKEL